MKDRLNQIRPNFNTMLPLQRKLLRVLLIFMLGAILGFLAKHTDSISIIGDIGTQLGFWVFTATIVSA